MCIDGTDSAGTLQSETCSTTAPDCISANQSMEDPEAAEPRGWRAFIIVVSTLAVDAGPDEQTNGQLPLLSS